MSKTIKLPEMQLNDINGVELELYDEGSGEPVVFVHGGSTDECYAVIQEAALTDHFRVIHYMRRGWGNSSDKGLPLSIEQQAEDCRAVMRHLGIGRAHLVGLSYGGTILLQFAVDFPEAVHTIALLEPALPSVLDDSPEYYKLAAEAAPFFEQGDIAAGLDTFFKGICGPEYTEVFDKTLPSGWFERWLADSDTLFQHDIPELEAWEFGEEDAARISAPLLNMTGENTKSFFKEIHRTVQSWIPDAENIVLPDATHAMLQMNPKGSAEKLAEFFSRRLLHF